MFQYYRFLPFPFPEYISKESLCDRRGDRILSGLKGTGRRDEHSSGRILRYFEKFDGLLDIKELED